MGKETKLVKRGHTYGGDGVVDVSKRVTSHLPRSVVSAERDSRYDRVGEIYRVRNIEWPGYHSPSPYYSLLSGSKPHPSMIQEPVTSEKQISGITCFSSRSPSLLCPSPLLFPFSIVIRALPRLLLRNEKEKKRKRAASFAANARAIF